MELFLAATAIGLLCAVAVNILVDDLRFVPGHMPSAVVLALGFGLATPGEPNSDTMNQFGIMVMLGGVLLRVQYERRTKRAHKQ